MIEWMQKHKKWLVVTIWISTIAFIGAGGFVWGMYDYSFSNNAVAKVGKISISRNEFSQQYQRVFQQYNQAQGGNLDEAQAKAMGLESIALNSLIANALLENYALDLGLRVSDEELAHTLSTDKAYEFIQTDGAIDLQKYDALIRSNGLTKQYFEEQAKNNILREKIIALLFPQIRTSTPMPTTDLERDSLEFSLRIKDTIELSVIRGASIPIQVDEKGLQAFWDTHKDAYKTPDSYVVQAIITKSADQAYDEAELWQFYEQNYIIQKDENSAELVVPESIKPQVILALQQKKAKIVALKDYAKLQKAPESRVRATQNALTQDDSNNDKKTSDKDTKRENKEGLHIEERIISLDSNAYSKEILQALESSKQGNTLKPLPYGDDFITLKITKHTPPTIRPFSEVRQSVQEQYLQEKRLQELHKLATAKLATFRGERATISMPTQEDVIYQRFSINGLDTRTSLELFERIFESNTSANYAIIGGNAFLFRITSQALTPASASQDSSNSAAMFANQVKMQLMDQLIFDFLERRYKIQKFIES